MNSYVIGNNVSLLAEFSNNALVASDPNYWVDPTTVTFSVMKPGAPSATVLSGSAVVRDQQGQYHATVTTDTVGTWQYYTRGTGTVSAVSAPQSFTVTAAPF